MKDFKDKQLEAIVKSRTIVISDAVSQELMAKVLALLTFMEADDTEKPITVIINTPGGEAYSGLGLYDALRFARSPIRAIVNGLCASAGILVLLAAEPENRFSLPNSRFMIHQPSGGARGSSSDIQIEAIEIKKLRSVYFDIIGKSCGKEGVKVQGDADRNLWFGSEEAVEYGLISKVVTFHGDLD